MDKKLYLDNAATTPVDTQVVRAMNEYFRQDYFNVAAKYSDAENTLAVVENVRKTIADKIGAKTKEIIFTSGGTESNNIAIQGIIRANPLRKQIIVSQIEHPSVLEICREYEKYGFEIDYVGVDENGVVDVEAVKKLLCENTLLVSIMHVNNETGAIAPIKEIGKLCREKDIYFHTDAVQSFAKLDVDVSKMNVDLLSASGHKINGPKGIGFLYVREGVAISPLTFGGGQEKNLRSGTLNVAGIVGLGKAVEISRNYAEIRASRDLLLAKLLEIPGSRLNGSLETMSFNILNLSFKGIEGEALLFKLDNAGIMASAGSACSSGKVDTSHVLEAMGVTEDYVRGAIRFSVDTLSREEINYVFETVKSCVEKLRSLSPFVEGDFEENESSKRDKNMTIAELIEDDPDAREKLLEMGLGCAGCAMAQIETIEQGAMAHGMDPKMVLEGLQNKKEKRPDGE